MATKTIGPTGDYTTLALYAAYLDTLNALAAPEVGKVQTGLAQITSAVNFTGFTPSSTNTWTLQADDGASFRENANAATNELRFNTSNGAYIDADTGYAIAVSVGVGNVIIKDLQFRQTAVNGQGLLHLGSSGNQTIEECIFDGKGVSNEYLVGWTGGSNHTVKNFLIVSQTANYHFPFLIAGSSTLINGTIVRPSNLSPGTPANDRAIATFYNGPFTITNVVAYNFSAFAKSHIGTPSQSGTNNATDLASFPSGLSGQTSLTATTEFEEPSNASSVMDWRLASTSAKCKDLGTNTGAPTTDIIGQSISNTTRDIGAWELQQGGGGGQTLTPSLFTNSQTFHAPTVTRGSVSLTPSLFTNSQTFHSPTVAATYDLTPSLYTNTQTFFAATVSPGAVTLTPALFTNSQTFFGPTVTQGDTLLPSLFTNTQTFYGPTITVGAVTLEPELFTNDNRFFGATVTGGVQVEVSTKPDGAPGHRIKFRGRFYDSKRDRYRLARDVESFLSEKQEEAPKPQKKPKKRVIRTEVAAIPAPKVVLDTREIDELTEVLTALKARDGQLRAYVAQLKAMTEALMAEEEEFLMMVA